MRMKWGTCSFLDEMGRSWLARGAGGNFLKSLMDTVAFADIKAVSREFFRERSKDVPRLLGVAVADGRHRQHHARERRQVMPARGGDLELAYPQDRKSTRL